MQQLGGRAKGGCAACWSAGNLISNGLQHVLPWPLTCAAPSLPLLNLVLPAAPPTHPPYHSPPTLQGKRYSLPNSRIMIHQPLGGAQGQATDIEIQANEILHHKLTLNGYLVRGARGGW